MNERQAFKLAFLRRCAERGLTPDEIETLADTGTIKQADGQGFLSSLLNRAVPSAVGGGLAGPGGAALVGTGQTLRSALLPTLLGSAAVGGGGGYLAGMAMDSLDEQNPEEIKQRDIINRYNLAAQKAEQLNAHAKQRQALAGRRAHWRG